MKTKLLLILGLLLLALSTPAQSSWLRRLPHGAGCPDCAPPDDSSSVRLMAQAAPLNRGEKISDRAPTPPATQPTNSTPVAVSTSGETKIGFNILAGYRLSIPPELESNATNGLWADVQINAMIPANVMALNHQRVAVDGFMIPSELVNGKVVEFILAESPPSCCFGGPTQIHDWIKVRVKPPGVPAMEYNVIRARGVLSVGAKRENGVLSGIYSMEADSVTEAPRK